MSDSEIRSAVAAGATDADELARRCGAGARCGGCASVVQAILSETVVTISVAA